MSNTGVVVDAFTYADFHEVKDRGLVVTGALDHDARLIEPGMRLKTSFQEFSITAVERQATGKRTAVVGLLLQGLHEDHLVRFRKGDRYSVVSDMDHMSTAHFYGSSL